MNRDEAEIREQFMAVVYDELTEDGTNDRANRIIGAFDDATTALTADLAAMTAERDAAVRDIASIDPWHRCHLCSQYSGYDVVCDRSNYIGCAEFKWRGMEDNTNESTTSPRT